MPVAVVITNPEEACSGLHWATTFCPPGESIIVFAPVATHAKDVHEPRALPKLTEDETPLLGQLRETVERLKSLPADEPIESPSGVIHTLEVAAEAVIEEQEAASLDRILLCEVDQHTAVEEIVAAVRRQKISLLVVPQTVVFEKGEPEDDARRLFTEAPCTTILLRPAPGEPTPCQHMLVATSGGVHSREALKLATNIADRTAGRVTAIYIEPPIDEVASEVGQRELARIVGSTVGSHKRVEQKVVVAKHILDGVAEEAHHGYDLLLLGTSNHGFLRRALFGTIPERLLHQGDGPTVAVLRKALPLTRRLRQAVRERVERRVPQLDREMRVEFVSSLQDSSRFGFDFVALICLSTIIAALGLIRDSGAVVIGAMLVAPLMTPLVASGLSLVQGNWHLIKTASRTVFGGFLLAFAIGVILGITVPGLTPTDEMLSRGSPSAVDLLIALVSGMAAAYAGSRPQLLSALPGVAIAASLIPPVATSGMALAIGDVSLACGSSLLFLTNIVAIVLGTALSLWAVGVRGGHKERGPRRWAIGVSIALVVVAAGLAYYERLPHTRMPSGMSDAVKSAIEKHAEVDLLMMEPDWSDDGGASLHLTVTAPGPITDELQDELQRLVQEHNVHCTIDVRIRQHFHSRANHSRTNNSP